MYTKQYTQDILNSPRKAGKEQIKWFERKAKKECRRNLKQYSKGGNKLKTELKKNTKLKSDTWKLLNLYLLCMSINEPNYANRHTNQCKNNLFVLHVKMITSQTWKLQPRGKKIKLQSNRCSFFNKRSFICICCDVFIYNCNFWWIIILRMMDFEKKVLFA